MHIIRALFYIKLMAGQPDCWPALFFLYHIQAAQYISSGLCYNRDKGGSIMWENRIVGEGTEAPEQLLANPHNWRIHPKRQQTALAAVLDEIGWVQRVIVNRRTGHVVDGHLRVALAISRNEPAVPVLYIDVSEDEERLIIASFDPLSAMAVTDKEMLHELLDGLRHEHEELVSALAAQSEINLTDMEFPEYDESVANNVRMVECPECGHRFPA